MAGSSPATPTRRGRAPIVIAVVAALAVLGGVLTWVLWPEPPPPPAPVAEEPPDEEPAPVEEPPPEEALRHPLTGEPTDEIPDRPAVLVKVSNSPEARPQTGLEHADMVFEEVTEGGITRFMAVYHSQLPEVVGPVRSARPVDVQLLSGFGAPLFAYSGARAEVRALIAGSAAVAIDESARGFFRDAGTYASHPFAPHNLFLRPLEALEAADATRPLPDPGWGFDEEVPEDAVGVGEELAVRMSPSFTTRWRYDADAGVYRRGQNDAEPATGPDAIGAANVIVLDVRHYTGASGYPETDVVGEGPALVLRDGQRYEARWSKPTTTSPIRLETPDGRPFRFKPGPSFIHLPDELPTPDG